MARLDWTDWVALGIADLKQSGRALADGQKRLVTIVLATAFFNVLFVIDAGTLAALLSSLTMWFVSSMLAVVWHRHYILGEAIPGRERDLARMAWSYFKAGLVIAIVTIPVLLVALPLVMLPFPDQLNANQSAPSPSAMLILSFVTNLVTGSLCLMLPAAAVNRSLPLQEAWTLSQGNRLALAIALTAISMPYIASNFLVFWVGKGSGVIAGLMGLVSTFCWLLAFALAVSMINAAYLRLVPAKD